MMMITECSEFLVEGWLLMILAFPYFVWNSSVVSHRAKAVVICWVEDVQLIKAQVLHLSSQLKCDTQSLQLVNFIRNKCNLYKLNPTRLKSDTICNSVATNSILLNLWTKTGRTCWFFLPHDLSVPSSYDLLLRNHKSLWQCHELNVPKEKLDRWWSSNWSPQSSRIYFRWIRPLETALKWFG